MRGVESNEELNACRHLVNLVVMVFTERLQIARDRML